MAKNLIISIMAVLLVTVGPGEADAGASKKAKPLTDGFFLAGVDGRLIGPDSNDVWLFGFDSDILELLPSAALEKMAADVEKRSNADYRLWAKVTKYRGKNFIFPFYFLPLSKPAASQRPGQQAEPTINEPNDVLAIPQEVIAKLQKARIIRSEQFPEALELKTDYILADRTGFIRGSGHKVRFVFDALGRGVQYLSLQLLGCEVLEQACRIQSAQPDPLRFKIAGIVTEYKGGRYLLLQRATRVYSHGNFNY